MSWPMAIEAERAFYKGQFLTDLMKLRRHQQANFSMWIKISLIFRKKEFVTFKFESSRKNEVHWWALWVSIPWNLPLAPPKYFLRFEDFKERNLFLQRFSERKIRFKKFRSSGQLRYILAVSNLLCPNHVLAP